MDSGKRTRPLLSLEANTRTSVLLCLCFNIWSWAMIIEMISLSLFPVFCFLFCEQDFEFLETFVPEGKIPPPERDMVNSNPEYLLCMLCRTLWTLQQYKSLRFSQLLPFCKLDFLVTLRSYILRICYLICEMPMIK